MRQHAPCSTSGVRKVVRDLEEVVVIVGLLPFIQHFVADGMLWNKVLDEDVRLLVVLSVFDQANSMVDVVERERAFSGHRVLRPVGYDLSEGKLVMNLVERMPYRIAE